MRRIQRREARRQGLDPRFLPYLAAQIGAESGFRTNIGSPAGAQDVAQFMPGTAPSYGVRLGDNRIKDDIRGQVRMMAPLIKKYGIEGALRAYNAGPGAIEASKGYAETNAYVKRVMGSAGKYDSPVPARTGRRGRVENMAASLTGGPGVGRRDLLMAYLQDRDSDPDALLNLAIGLSQQKAAAKAMVPARQVTADAERHPNDPVAALAREADLIDGAKVPYQWGGGHAGKQPRGSKVTPLDCSGAVSRVLGINPRVSGQFTSWGRPGKGKRVTIYANAEHVLMEIDGHFFGTSSANPGGGAGWIPRRFISKEYLSRFVARHPKGA